MEITTKTIKTLKKNTNSVIDQLADLYATENSVAEEILSLQEEIKELQEKINEDKDTLVSIAKEKQTLTTELVAQLDEVKNTFVSNVAVDTDDDDDGESADEDTDGSSLI